MNTILKPIALNERSYNVNLLHIALEALGLSISKKEVFQGKGWDNRGSARILKD